jgi:hypothetical protein
MTSDARTNIAAGTSAAKTVAHVQTQLRERGAQHIGDLISWNTGGIDVLRSLAREVFDIIGMGRLVPDMDPETALNRAVKEARLKRADGFVAQQFKRPNQDTPLAWGIYEVTANDGEDGDGLVIGARVRLESGIAVARAPINGSANPECMAKAQVIAEHANHLISHAETRDISVALTSAVFLLSGVPMRNRGGFYLLPPGTCEQWHALITDLTKLGVEPLVIEMFDAPHAVAAAASAARGALEEQIAELVSDLDKAKGDGLRSDALERRLASCDALCSRAMLFQDVLHDLAERIRDRAAGLRTEFAKLVKSTDDADAALFHISASAA